MTALRNERKVHENAWQNKFNLTLKTTFFRLCAGENFSLVPALSTGIYSCFSIVIKYKNGGKKVHKKENYFRLRATIKEVMKEEAGMNFRFFSSLLVYEKLFHSPPSAAAAKASPHAPCSYISHFLFSSGNFIRQRLGTYHDNINNDTQGKKRPHNVLREQERRRIFHLISKYKS